MGKQWNKIYTDKLNKYNYYDLLKPHEDLYKFVEILQKSNAKNILELESGTGRNLVALVEQGFNLSAIEQSIKGIEITDQILEAKNLYANIINGDLLKKLPFNDNSFDAVFSTKLHHATESELLSTITEIKRVLKPNGLIFMIVPFRKANGKVRPIIVKSATKIAENTYIPTQGDEKGLIHFIYNQKLINKHYNDFQIIKKWKDSLDYFCFIAKLK